MRLRSWSVRNKLVALLALPLVSLAALWAYAAYLSLGNALTLEHTNTIGNRLAPPMVAVFTAVGHERRDSVVMVSDRTTPTTLDGNRAVTDAEVKKFLAQAQDSGVRDDESPRVRAAVGTTEQALAALGTIRKGVNAGTLSSDQVMASYTAIDTAIEQALHAMVILPDQDAEAYGETLYDLAPAGDLLSQEDALISAAAVSPSHLLSPADYGAAVQDIGSQRYLTVQAIENLPEAQRAEFEKLAAPGGAIGNLTALEQKVIAAGPAAKALPFSIDQWRATYDREDATVGTLSVKDISAIFTRTGPPAHRALLELILSGVLGLLALIVSVVISTSIARSLVGDVAKLGRSARNLTDDRLRDVVGRLRRGETVDVRSDMTEPRFANQEMAQLGEAFFALQLTAVELAQEDIRLHRGISDVFLNLARRSQALVHRQLALIDSMEAREEDPKALADLFRLDQLATRMRRYAEGLIIVSGAPPGRFWRHPVPVVDVIRGAISETEQYARVVVPPAPAVGVLGRAAADIIHLLAELIENAEMFSPEDSQVRVSLSRASGGLVIEIDDRGLGMKDEDMAAANARITADFDVTSLDSTQLGLVTVGRLAQRHGVSVSLRNSPYGGVAAVVLVPHALLEWGNNALAELDATAIGGAAEPPRRLPETSPTGGELDDGTNISAPVDEYSYQPLDAPAPALTYENPTHARPVTDTQFPSHAYEMPAHGTYASPVPFPAADSGRPDLVDGLPRRVPQASLAKELRAEAETFGQQPVMDWGNSGDPTSPHHQGGYGRTVGHLQPPADRAAHRRVETGPGPLGRTAGDQHAYGQPGHGQSGYEQPVQDGGRQAPAVRRPREWEATRAPAMVPLFGAGMPSAVPSREPEYDAAPGDREDRPEYVRSIMWSLQAGAARARAEAPTPDTWRTPS